MGLPFHRVIMVRNVNGELDCGCSSSVLSTSATCSLWFSQAMNLTNYPNGPSPVTKELILGISNGVGSSMHNFVTPGELKTGYLTGNVRVTFERAKVTANLTTSGNKTAMPSVPRPTLSAHCPARPTNKSRGLAMPLTYYFSPLRRLPTVTSY